MIPRRQGKLLVAAAFSALWIIPVAFADVPAGFSDIYVQNTQLIVRKRNADGSLGLPAAYVIKGLTWNPASRAPSQGPSPLDAAVTVPYGFFFDWPGRNPPGFEVLNFWLRQQFAPHYQQDLALMSRMHVNTVRVYSDLGPETAAVLDECYRRGIMVVMTVAISKADIDSGRHLALVDQYKNHPAILMWSLGNEWNLNNLYSADSMNSLTAAINGAAEAIALNDEHHPVTSSLGDRFSAASACMPDDPCCAPPAAQSDVASIVAAADKVQVWGINVYRGAGFGGLFSQWQAASAKPVYLSEFGTDSFRTLSQADLAGLCGPHRTVTGVEDQPMQAAHALGLWAELAAQLSAAGGGQVIGGFLHEFNDELWKTGSFHAGLGNAVDYNGADNVDNTPDDDSSHDEYNPHGFALIGAHPDGFSNEEYFGVVDADRNPKQALTDLKLRYAALAPLPHVAVSGRVVTAEGSPLPGVAVRLAGTGRYPNRRRTETVTDSQGRFLFVDLQTTTRLGTLMRVFVNNSAGDYPIRVGIRARKPGYRITDAQSGRTLKWIELNPAFPSDRDDITLIGTPRR